MSLNNVPSRPCVNQEDQNRRGYRSLGPKPKLKKDRPEPNYADIWHFEEHLTYEEFFQVVLVHLKSLGKLNMSYLKF
jgi:hypothetical protein